MHFHNSLDSCVHCVYVLFFLFTFIKFANTRYLDFVRLQKFQYATKYSINPTRHHDVVEIYEQEALTKNIEANTEAQ